MLKNEKHSKTFSKPIVTLSIIGVALGLAMMIITISIATGFKSEIKEKLLSFGNHIQIESIYQNTTNETSPISTISFPKDSIIKKIPDCKIQKYAYKAAIIQSKKKQNNINTNLSTNEVEGVVFKALDSDYDPTFFTKYLIKGSVPDFSKQNNDTIILSNSQVNKLNISLYDPITAFFISDGKPKQRNLVLGGIYETGLDNIDNKFGFISLKKLIKINRWGFKLYVDSQFSKDSSRILFVCKNQSKKGDILYKWGNDDFTTNNELTISALKDTSIEIIGIEVNNLDEQQIISIPDTINIKYSTSEKKFSYNNKMGSEKYYTGGYEIILNNFEQIEEKKAEIKSLFGPEYAITTIQQRHEEMFDWLNLIYQNVYIIIGLMIVVAIINMSAALLVLIVEKTKMIGILKALGISNIKLRKIFIIHSGYLIIGGFILGNLIALSIIAIQNQFNILKLPQENYYLEAVPMHMPIAQISLVNLGAFICCFTAMILPTFISTKISPVKAIASEI